MVIKAKHRCLVKEFHIYEIQDGAALSPLHDYSLISRTTFYCSSTTYGERYRVRALSVVMDGVFFLCKSPLASIIARHGHLKPITTKRRVGLEGNQSIFGYVTVGARLQYIGLDFYIKLLFVQKPRFILCATEHCSLQR